MKSLVWFFAIVAFIFLVPLVLMGLVVYLTSCKLQKRPKGYYLGYALWMFLIAFVIAAIFHMWGQVLAGVIVFQPKSFRVAWVFTLEQQPYSFGIMAVFYIFLSVAAVMVLIKTHRALVKHFHAQQAALRGPQ